LIVAEVLGPPGYRENAVSGRCPGYHPPTLIQTVLPPPSATMAANILSASRCILAGVTPY
jgi:hypothetical protein